MSFRFLVGHVRMSQYLQKSRGLVRQCDYRCARTYLGSQIDKKRFLVPLLLFLSKCFLVGLHHPVTPSAL